MRKGVFILLFSLFVLTGCEKRGNEEVHTNSAEMESNSTNDKNEDTRWVQELNIESDQIKGVKIDAVLCEEDIPRHVITAKEVYYSDDYISEQENLLGASYRVDFMDSTEVNTETEKMWMSEYGEGTGYRMKWRL